VKPVRKNFIIVATVVVTATLYLCHQILYKLILVPKLPELKQVPLLWWAGVGGLIPLAILVMGNRIRSWAEFLAISVLTAFAKQFYEFLATHLNQPGFLKSFAVEDPFFFWTRINLESFVFFAILYGIG